MINSLFIFNELGGVIAEKHWDGILNRSVCDPFFEELAKHLPSLLNLPPMISTGRYYLFNVPHISCKPTAKVDPSQIISGNGAFVGSVSTSASALLTQSPTVSSNPKLFFVAVCSREMSNVLVPIEFLHKLLEAFEEYFGPGFSELDLTEEFTKVYEILEEVADNGYPIFTESAMLAQLVAPPSLLAKLNGMISTTNGDVSSKLSVALASSDCPWRRRGARYPTNEFFLDVVEDVDAILDSNGTLVSSQVVGALVANSKLGGMPDLTLAFANPSLLEDVWLHPCVRNFRWEQNRVLSFVPPDGRFRLMGYRVRGGVQPPLAIRPAVTFTETGGKVEVTVTSKHFPDPKIYATDVVIKIPFPKSVTNVTFAVSQGSFVFDQKTKICTWSVGALQLRLQKDSRVRNNALPSATLSGSLSIAGGVKPEANPIISAQFKIMMFTASGIRVDSLNVKEGYKPYKGIRSVTRGGQYFIRT